MAIRKGFSLLEFILYFALLSIIVTVVTSFTVDIIKTRAKAEVIAEVEQNTRFLLLRIVRSTRRATGINNGGSTFNNDNGVLSLNQDGAALSPTVFDLSGGAVRIKEGAASATPLTAPDVTVTKLRFSKDSLGSGGKSITAEITVRYDGGASPEKGFNYTISATATAVVRKD